MAGFDPYFDGLSFLNPDDPFVPARGNDEARAKATALLAIGKAVRNELLKQAVSTALFGRHDFATAPAYEQGAAIFSALAMSADEIDALRRSPTSRPLAELAAEFQRFVPVVAASRISQLTTAPDNVIETARNARAMLVRKEITSDQFRRGMQILAANSEIQLPEKLSADQTVELLTAKCGPSRGNGAVWTPRGQGADTHVFGDGSGLLYKISPIGTNLLTIPEIKDGSPIFPRIGEHPFADLSGRIPVLERVHAGGTILGLAQCELVALTDSGKAIMTQIDLGDVAPPLGKLKQWAQDFHHVALPPQGEDPKGEFDPAVSHFPIITKVDRDYHLVLDVSPRTSREFDGSVIPFGTVSRPLLAREIAANEQLRRAVHEIENPPPSVALNRFKAEACIIDELDAPEVGRIGPEIAG